MLPHITFLFSNTCCSNTVAIILSVDIPKSKSFSVTINEFRVSSKYYVLFSSVVNVLDELSLPPMYKSLIFPF